jgi:hypothetical protein
MTVTAIGATAVSLRMHRSTTKVIATSSGAGLNSLPQDAPSASAAPPR